MAGGGGYAQAGMAGTGAILGGIGDIISAANYERPHLEEATGREKRLRDLAQSQLLGGGQQLLGGTALYNQMAPILMGQLPGMRFVPGGGGDPSLGDVTEAAGAGGALGSYQEALANMQQAQAAQQKLTALKAAKKGVKQGGGRKKAAGKAIKEQKKVIAGMPTVAERERQMYTAGAQPGSFDIRQGAGPTGPSQQSSLGAIQGMMDALRGSGPNLGDLYRGASGDSGVVGHDLLYPQSNPAARPEVSNPIYRPSMEQPGAIGGFPMAWGT